MYKYLLVDIFLFLKNLNIIWNKGKCDCKINIIFFIFFWLYIVLFMYNVIFDIYSIFYDEFYLYRINLILILYEWCIVWDLCVFLGIIIYDGYIFKLWFFVIFNLY